MVMNPGYCPAGVINKRILVRGASSNSLDARGGLYLVLGAYVGIVNNQV